MTAERDIVYLSRTPWDSIYQRPQHLAAGLAGSARVLYVDTPRSTFNRRFLTPLLRRQTLRPLLSQPAPGLTVLSPAYVPFLPGWWPPPGQYHVHRLFLRWAMRRLGMASPILWTQDPRDLFFVDAVAPRLVCYDCMDDYALIAPPGVSRPALREQELAMLRRANLVFASSEDLLRRCSQTNGHVVLVPNGVDAGRFGPAPTPADVAGIARPRLGYVGAIAPWLDFGLLEALAQARPQLSLVLVGPVQRAVLVRVAALQRLPNVHVLGERPYVDVPAYMHSFDICLIPFLINDLTRAVTPVKFWEYMAAARPVVSTVLPELAPYANVCALAGDVSTFIAAVDAALSTSSETDRERRLALAQANSWAERVKTIEQALAAALAA
jgi:glycosyltransferase involved in cell wall biosynthesis